MTKQKPISKQNGSTDCERYLSKLCDKSFLSLWSYPGVYRDQGKHGEGDGKEICDLLVVFRDDLIIFSDKDCKFPDSGNLDLDWSRWFRRAVEKSAKQVWGAERWIVEYPNQLFVDRRCTQRLPVSLPTPERLRVHRVVVAHDVARRCRELLGGSGSLVVFPALQGNAHVTGPISFPGSEVDPYESWARSLKPNVGYTKTVFPFAVGDLDPHRGFVHVFDDTGLAVVMTELDTTADFVQYLTKREAYIRNGRLAMAAGEDDLLAHYMQFADENGLHSFYTPDDPNTKVCIPEGEWDALQHDSSWKSRKQADSASYVWDKLIERFNSCIIDGSSAAYPDANFDMQELAVRALASENRFQRRFLACVLGEFLSKKSAMAIESRVVERFGDIGRYYVFLTVRPKPSQEHDEYRKLRWGIALSYLLRAKQKYPEAREVVVFATEPADWTKWTTEDAMYRGDEPLSEEELEFAREAEKQGTLTRHATPIELRVSEYPRRFDTAVDRIQHKSYRARSMRNSQCPCGSGKKYKICCMRRHRTAY